MADYFEKLTDLDRQRIAFILGYCYKRGIVNKFSQAAILSVCSKEAGFQPTPEKSYAKTSIERIRDVFGDRLLKYSDAQLEAIKKDPKQFFEAVYGKDTQVGRENGNTSPGDGYKYRGRGPNQITFKNTYIRIGKQIGVDLENNPDLLNEFDTGMKATIQYFINCFNSAPGSRKKIYNFTDINSFKTLEDAVKAFYHANAGFGKKMVIIEADKTGGRKKAISRAPGFYSKFVEQFKP